MEGAFYWAETMPEEILWSMLALESHLEALHLGRLIEEPAQGARQQRLGSTRAE